tara:strand:- start:201 stop:467 length:267 start_codon:yes stop_codon:yes gene_type:complete
MIGAHIAAILLLSLRYVVYLKFITALYACLGFLEHRLTSLEMRHLNGRVIRRVDVPFLRSCYAMTAGDPTIFGVYLLEVVDQEAVLSS